MLSKVMALVLCLTLIGVWTELRADEPQTLNSSKDANIPQVVLGKEYSKQLSDVAGVDESQIGNLLADGSKHDQTDTHSRWVKLGSKTLKLIKKAEVHAGKVYEVVSWGSEAAELEQKFEKGELTRDQADAEQAKLLLNTAVTTLSGPVGRVGGTMIGAVLLGPTGGVVGGFVGENVGERVRDEAMKLIATSGFSDALGDVLRPVAATVRETVSNVKETAVVAASAIGETATDGANWVGEKGKSSWRLIRRQVQ